MPYHIAAIDVHKMLAVAVADVAVEGDFHFERLKAGTSPVQLARLAVLAEGQHIRRRWQHAVVIHHGARIEWHVSTPDQVRACRHPPDLLQSRHVAQPKENRAIETELPTLESA